MITLMLLAGCGSAIVASVEPSEIAQPPSPLQSPSQSATPTASPSSPSPNPTPQPPTATPSAIALDQCTSESGIYAVTYPGHWYSNGAGLNWDSWDDCSLFAPQPFVDPYDPAIDIRLLAQPNLGWNDPFTPLTGDFEGYVVVRDEATQIGGRDAWVREFELTTSVSGSHSAGDKQLTYAVDIGGGWFLYANAVVTPEDYDQVSAVLGSMLDTLEVLEVPAP